MQYNCKKHRYTDKDKKDIMRRRTNGESVMSIGASYGRDYSTIVYHLRKWREELREEKLKPKMKKEQPKRVSFKKHINEDIIFEKVNKGKSYAEYLEDERKRLKKRKPRRGASI